MCFARDFDVLSILPTAFWSARGRLGTPVKTATSMLLLVYTRQDTRQDGIASTTSIFAVSFWALAPYFDIIRNRAGS
ncbi:hypothetical protein NEOLEDRAFT_1133103 [Neolentinus lepideus HHB14362 ss-1]|uniref:Uncharacterized protein n=1 Tax=Neolentinus lepideus HHB14362 ss-1 TaxID=1314782 RepID=A0A165ST74_9AGAM|nr:hypothetical protein NEOLEDRAFT_1133103 [Neolentinus lepideus HHB14362 ss-1]